MKPFLFFILLFVNLYNSFSQPVFFEKTFGSSGTDAGRRLVQFDNGNIYFVGYSDTNSTGTNLIALSKISASGNIIWTKYYSCGFNSNALHICKDNQSNLIACGQTDLGNFNTDAFVAKIDSNGNLKWLKTYGDNSVQSFKYIEPCKDGGFIACGLTSDLSGSNDFYVVKIDSSGNQIWKGNYGGSMNDYASEIHELSNGGFIICGDTNSDGAGGYDIETIRLDSIGGVIWDALLGDSLNNGCQGILPLRNGKFAIYGETETPASLAFDFFIHTIDSSGNTIFRKTFGGTKPDALFSLLQENNGDFVFTGYSSSYSSGPLNLVIGKTDSLANLIWINSYGSAGIDIGYSLLKEKNNGYLAGGNSFQNGSDQFYLLHVNDSGKVIGIPSIYSLKNSLSIIPNPSNGEFVATWPEQLFENATVSIFSTDGACVFEQKNLQVNEKRLYVDLKNQLQDGLYFIRINCISKQFCAKICIQK